MTPSLSASRFTDVERTLQSRLAIVGPGKIIAIDLGIAPETVSRWKNADWPIPAFQAFAVSQSQKDFRYLRRLAERAGALLSLPRPSITHWSSIQLLATLVMSFGHFLVLAEQVNEGKEPLTDEQMQKFQEAGEQAKRAIDALVEKAREQRANKK